MTFLRSCLPSFLCFLAFTGHVQALTCSAPTTCQSGADCVDENNLQGLDQTCGNAACIDGVCEFVAWNEGGACATSNFIICAGVDAACTKGPGALNYVGTCTGWENNECVYKWCPGDQAGPPTTAPPPPTTAPPPPPPTTAPPPPTTAPPPPTTAPPPPTTAPPPPTTAPPPPTTAPPPPTTAPPPPTTAPPPPTTAPPPPTTAPPPSGCTPCTQASDCQDANNLAGLDPTCGNVACVAGSCEYAAWNDAGACASANFLSCGGVDALCTKGPRGLNFQGTCTGWNNVECIYKWCPGDEAPPTVAPVPTPTPEGCTPCQQNSDCGDPNNLAGLDPACGNLVCLAGTCQFEAWNTAGACGSNNFQLCSGDDSRCTKGPADLNFVGTCTAFENNECVYTWCPGDLKPPPTSAPTNSPTVPLPPSTEPPEFTLDVTEGFAGQAITLTGFDFGLTQGELKIGSRSCPILSWNRRTVKAYIADDASPGLEGLVMQTTDGRVSAPQTFTVKPPSLVPTPQMLDAVTFMREKMRNPEGGVFTAFLDSNNPDIVYLYGHHVTSEHMGLWLWVTAAILDHSLFEQTYQYIYTKMVETNPYDIVVWGINKDTGAPFGINGEYFNAPLDDFRVLKGLISGWMQWGDQRYLDLALRLGQGLRTTSVSPPSAFPAYPDGLVTSGFGWNEAVPPNTYTETEVIPVDYADLWTMQFLAQYDPEWLPIIAENIKMMEDAQLPNGQYLNSLIKATQSFSGDFEYQDDPDRKDKIKTIQSLWIAIHLARAGRTVSAQKALDFYKTYYYANGQRVPEYLNQDGSEATVPNQLLNGEVRIYAQIARLSYYLGDKAFGDELVQNKIYLDQETNTNLETFGHLGKANGSVDPESFNTLEGLLAMAFELGSTVVGAPTPSLYPKLPAGIQWQWQLKQFVYPNDLVRNTTDEGSIQLYDIDLWSNTPEVIADLKARGKVVACYFEAGTWASWRAEPGGDYERAGVSFLPETIGSEYEPPYVNERWFNVSHPNVRDNMKKIMDYAKSKGCQYVEPDNVQGFERDSYCTGFETCEASCNGPDPSWLPELVCQADYDIWLDFNIFLAEEAHKRGMGVLLKNNWYQAQTLLNYHDAALTEQCFEHNKCWHLVPFLDADKAVLVVEYDITDAQMCTDAHALSSSDLFSVIKKVPDLDFFRRGCCGATPCPQSSVQCGPSDCP